MKGSITLRKLLEFIKEYKKVFLIPLILMVVLTLIIFVLSSLSPESDFKYLG
ncbi:uncharacterized protein METZ01_LOCUS164929 [marine metagenome]|uniref:Uncharacterized protein n=1 Tax=marine metagenome TaxID=408172 RepID=A0A382BE25_9ZZZZ